MNPRDADTAGEPGGPDRVDNGLHAPRYVPLTDVEPAIAQHLLSALGRARIPAYLDAATTERGQRRLFVASEERGDARTIVAAAVKGLGPGGPNTAADPLDGVDADAAFDALVADWHVDTVAAVREAERDLTREDAEWRARLSQPQAPDEVWLDDDHYVPPPPPPLPRLSGTTIAAILLVVLSVLMLAFGTVAGFADNVALVLGIGGLVFAAALFFTRVREYHRDEDDDGSAV